MRCRIWKKRKKGRGIKYKRGRVENRRTEGREH
jgi:hypothetical protein